ncbi:alpha/beta fold hydrolase [Streptosporangium carneum]|uniref:Oxidoreductase n=1 Tax=Streptosporangium carneum TaxID=47481 RepID=A0A9W6I3Y3_9ACTN|nr:alpha/beta hydrolase [Streptosporangium carneum]GLK11625.1 oxidoreductase [Streptosporangium carneum]
MTTTHGYAPVNGLEMYYEVHGTGAPLVLIHGSFSGIGTSFGRLLPHLAKNRQVIAVELQGHGRTADIDRPLTIPHLADDVAALLRHLDVGQADVLGYSLGAGITLELARRHPELTRKLVLVSLAHAESGFNPGLLEGMSALEPAHLEGSPFHQEYLDTAPNPQDFPTLVAKVKRMTEENPYWSAEAVRSVQTPVLTVIGDSDIVRPEHAAEMFRLFGGGVAGDVAGLPNSRLAVLPGTTHVTVVHRADLLAPMVEEFLDAPVTQND